MTSKSLCCRAKDNDILSGHDIALLQLDRPGNLTDYLNYKVSLNGLWHFFQTHIFYGMQISRKENPRFFICKTFDNLYGFLKLDSLTPSGQPVFQDCGAHFFLCTRPLTILLYFPTCTVYFVFQLNLNHSVIAVVHALFQVGTEAVYFGHQVLCLDIFIKPLLKKRDRAI